MLIPRMNEPRVQRVNVPSLYGGINPGSVGEAVSDYQLTDCKNVWYQGGEVITRPKLETIDTKETEKFNILRTQSIYSFYEGRKIKINVDNSMNILVLSADKSNEKIYAINNCKKYLASGITNNINDVDVINYCSYSSIGNGEQKGIGYLLVRFRVDSVEYRKVYKILLSENTWTDGENADKVSLQNVEWSSGVYIPHVLINGLGNFNAKLPRTDDAEALKTTQLEGFNLLSGAYKCSYTTDSISNAYFLPVVPNGNVKINITCNSMFTGNSFRFYQSGDENISFTEQEAGFYKENADGTVERVETLEFTILNDKTESEETYYIDGRCPCYLETTVTKLDRLYYRCKFKCKISRETGKITFPFLKLDDSYCQLYKSSSGSVTDEFTNTELSAETTKSLTGKHYTDDTKIDTVNIDGAYIVYDDTGTLETYETTTTDGYVTWFPKLSSYKKESWLRLPRNGNIYNNMEVIVYNEIIEEDFDKLVNCMISETYGGTVGINYGTRVFVSGFNNNLYFSDVDNPLYFPENCQIAVGNKDERITAFSKQSGYLIIFKENSIYYTYETEIENDNLSEQVQNQSVVDITAQYMYKIMSVNSEVGCDLPDTIQLCMNKIIFANSAGDIYILNSLSNYSERNIYCVSGLIKHKLKKYKSIDWSKAFALDYQDHYMLFVDDMGFILDYNKNAYKYVSSYTKDSSVRKYGLFSWWIWQFPKYLRFGISTGNDISLVLSTDNDTNFELCTLSSEPEDECESYIVSKFFNFGSPDFYKGIDRLQLDMGNDYDATIWIEHMTDGGTVTSDPIEIYKTGKKGDATYLRGRIIYPNIRLCRNYGFKITAKGPMALSSVIINYSLKGSVKNGR